VLARLERSLVSGLASGSCSMKTGRANWPSKRNEFYPTSCEVAWLISFVKNWIELRASSKTCRWPKAQISATSEIHSGLVLSLVSALLCRPRTFSSSGQLARLRPLKNGMER
jgi:hypothetical protein